MKPQDFLYTNRLLTGAGGVGSLPVFADDKEVISCWRPTDEERRAIAAGAPIWLRVMTALSAFPPVALTAEEPFEERPLGVVLETPGVTLDPLPGPTPPRRPLPGGGS